MQGIGPGSILGGRYTADRRTAQYAGAERWTARDSTLDRYVVLLTVPRSHPNVDAVLDAARRSGSLDNARLSRILDVGTDDDVAYIVEEALDGSHSLAALLSAGPLPAPEVRRIAGETALVLDLARNRGLHHQRLTPDLVLRTVDGDVKVRGLATMAALAGVDDVDDQTAARTDAVAAVAIAYAGFTGHWPLPGHGGGLPPAPRVASHVAAPSEIAVGVPADLDALCRLTFANDQGPTTPGDFARQIAPWSPIPVLLPTLDAPEQPELSHSGATSSRPRPSPQPAAPEPAGPDAPEPASPREEAPGGSASRRGAPSTAEGASVPVARRVPGPADRPAAGSPTGAAAESPRPAGVTPTSPDTVAGTPPARPPGKAPTTPTTTPPGTTTPATTTDATALQKPPAKTVARPTGPSPLAAMTAATSAALGSAGAATVSAAKTLSGRLNDWSASTRDRARVVVDDARARRGGTAAARTADGERTAPPRRRDVTGPSPMGTLGRGGPARDRDTLEPPVPLLPASAGVPLTRDQSRMAVGIVVGFLVLALVLAMWGLSRIPSIPTFSGSGDPAATGTPTAGETGEGADADATDADATDSDGDTADTPAAAAPLTFTAATDYDPLGDGAERPEELDFILDGDDATSWGSEGYRSAEFSGLKAGLGIVLDLGESSPVGEVTLVLPNESAGQIYVTDDEDYAGEGTPLADDLTEAGTFDGQGTVVTDLADGTSGRYVIVWFTQISTGEEEWYRARLAEASATS